MEMLSHLHAPNNMAGKWMSQAINQEKHLSLNHVHMHFLIGQFPFLKDFAKRETEDGKVVCLFLYCISIGCPFC